MLVRLLQNIRACATATGAALAIGLCGAIAVANPSSSEPMKPLDIHNLTNADPVFKTAENLFSTLLTDIQAISKNPARASGKILSESYARFRQLQRAATDLQMLGETAGADYALRATVLHDRLWEIVRVFKSTPAGQAYVAQIRQGLSSPRSAQARMAVLQKVQRLLQEQQLDEAYSILNDALDQLTSLTLFLESDRAQYERDFALVEEPITSGRNKAFRERARGVLKELAASLVPKTQQLIDDMTAAATALRTAPQATVAGQTLSGPQCLESFAAAAKQLHLSALRCRAVDWAYMSRTPAVAYLSDAKSVGIVAADYGKLYENLPTGFASLIEADAQRVAETEVPTLYVQYLKSLAPLIASTGDGRLEQSVQPALDKLAAKSPVFAEEVRAYATATDEMLRWRQRLAERRAAAAAGSAPTSDQAILSFFVSDDKYRGLYAPDDKTPAGAQLKSSCPEVIQTASLRALNKPVVVRDIVGLGAAKRGVARYHVRHYATVPLPDVSAEAAGLQQDLMITAQQPALSLAAAEAIDSALNGNYVAAGGDVKGFHIEGLIPRFAALRPETLPMVSLGPLSAEIGETAMISHVMIRLEVEPAWVHHKYFFLTLANAASTANTAR